MFERRGPLWSDYGTCKTIKTLAFRLKSFKPFKLFPFRSDAVSHSTALLGAWGRWLDHAAPPSGAGRGRYTATWKREFKLPWREAGPPNHHDDKVDSVVNKELSLWGLPHAVLMPHEGYSAESKQHAPRTCSSAPIPERCSTSWCADAFAPRAALG